MPKSNLIRQIESMYDEITTKEEWRRRFFDAYWVAVRSDDRSTKNGVLLQHRNVTVCTGFNHFIDGYGDLPEHHERPLKYSLTEHAERDVIYKAARCGIYTSGATMVGHWVACPDCARAIVEADIDRVVCHRQCMERTPERWEDMILLGLEILKRGDVELVAYDGKVGIDNLNGGEIWRA